MMIKDHEETYTPKERLEVMKPFLVNKFCYTLGCSHSDILCYADRYTCPCGFERVHKHCKNCGGIFF